MASWSFRTLQDHIWCNIWQFDTLFTLDTICSHIKKLTLRIMHIMHFNLCQKPMSKQRSTSCFIIIASQQKLVTLNSRRNSANKAICYAEVINMYSLHKFFCCCFNWWIHGLPCQWNNMYHSYNSLCQEHIQDFLKGDSNSCMKSPIAGV